MILHPSSASPAPGAIAEFEELLVAYQQPLLRFILSRVGNHHEAEDLLQKTNLVLWRKRACFEAGSNFKAWSFAIARLEISNRLRQQRRDQRLLREQQQVLETPADPGDRDEEKAASLAALEDCMKRLPPRDQELVLMRYGSRLTLSAYARNLNRSPGTLKARLFKIRENLRKSIEEHLRKRSGDRSFRYPATFQGAGEGIPARCPGDSPKGSFRVRDGGP